MEKFMIGTKGRMTQVYDETGRVHAATVVYAAPLTVTQVKTTEKDGYEAVQVGAGEKKEKNVAKAQKGHLKDLPLVRTMKEFRMSGEFQRGDTIDLSKFTVGDTIEVTAVSKGKGFQGVVKRHNFAGGRRSHGQKHSEREPGSIGAGGMQRVMKGLKMAGRMGGDRITVKNLKVLQVNADAGIILIKGAIPGRPGTTVEIHG